MIRFECNPLGFYILPESKSDIKTLSETSFIYLS